MTQEPPRSAPIRARSEHVDQAIRLVLSSRARVEAHRRVVRYATAVLLAIAVAHGLVLVQGPRNAGPPSWATVAFVVLGAVGAAVHARRLSRRSEEMLQTVFSLQFLRDVLEQGATELMIERTAGVETIEDWIENWGGMRPVSKASQSDRTRAAHRQLRWVRFAGAAGVAAVIAAALVLFGGRASTPQVTRTWSFVEAETDPAALGFQLSTRETGEWLLEAHEGATGNRALANRAGEPTALAAHAVVGDSMARDLKAWTRCKVSPERAQRACGLVLRHLDPNNYYVASVDAGRHIVTLSVVVAGVERELRSAPADLSSSGWQVVAVTADADYLEVSVNGGRPLSVHDATFPGPGRVGLWAPAEGEAYFDELSFSSHAPTRLHPSDLLPIFVRRKT